MPDLLRRCASPFVAFHWASVVAPSAPNAIALPGLAVHSHSFPRPHTIYHIQAKDRIRDLCITTQPLFEPPKPHQTTLQRDSKMPSRRGLFRVLPTDNTYLIEDFDMFKTVAKAPEPHQVLPSVGELSQNAIPIPSHKADMYSHAMIPLSQHQQSAKSSTPRSSSK